MISLFKILKEIKIRSNKITPEDVQDLYMLLIDKTNGDIPGSIINFQGDNKRDVFSTKSPYHDAWLQTLSYPKLIEYYRLLQLEFENARSGVDQEDEDELDEIKVQGNKIPRNKEVVWATFDGIELHFEDDNIYEVFYKYIIPQDYNNIITNDLNFSINIFLTQWYQNVKQNRSEMDHEDQVTTVGEIYDGWLAFKKQHNIQ